MKQKGHIPLLCALASVLLIVHHHIAAPAFFDAHLAHRFIFDPARELYRYVYSFGATFVVLGLLPLAIASVLWNRQPSDWGIAFGRRKTQNLIVCLAFFALMIPVLAYASTFPQIAAFHPFSRLAARHAKALLLYEGSLLLFIAGWEFFFRGFLLFGLKNELGDAAIYLQVIPYSVMYLNRPAAEALASIPAAIVLGHLASRTGSVLYGIVLHWVCALTLDMFIIYDVF